MLIKSILHFLVPFGCMTANSFSQYLLQFTLTEPLVVYHYQLLQKNHKTILGHSMNSKTI